MAVIVTPEVNTQVNTIHETEGCDLEAHCQYFVLGRNQTFVRECPRGESGARRVRGAGGSCPHDIRDSRGPGAQWPRGDQGHSRGESTGPRLPPDDDAPALCDGQVAPS